MAVFFSSLLDGFLSPSFLDGVRRKFHYGETEAAELRAVAEEMLPLLRRDAFWERKGLGGERENSGPVYESVAMSLGSGIDGIQESYSRKGLLSRSYMLEVLADELLMQGYSAYDRYIRNNTVWHTAGYHFPGSEERYPLEMLPRLLEGFSGQITCNAAYCMSPKKSVVFVAELTKDGTVRCEGICAGCGKKDCVNRRADDIPARLQAAGRTDLLLNYGYRRIFGRLD